MDARLGFLKHVMGKGLARGGFLGLLNLLIGRRIETRDGAVISEGITWRDMAGLLKKAHWDKNSVCELDLDPAALPPRQRERFWYTVIAHAQVDSEKATRAGDALASCLRDAGFVIGPAPQH